jgi:tripartite-type tricarboxylate transporter receptor subunit TctC
MRKTMIKLFACLGLLIAAAGPAAAQQAYPARPIRLIVAYPPGGSTDIVARLVGQKLTQSLGQPVVVDNRPGGNTTIASEAVVKAAPDGYTLLVASSDLVLVPLAMKVSYDPVKDFAPVATVARTELVLVLNASVPANNLQELIALAKSRPGQLNYATPGAGSGQHLATESLNLIAGMKTNHVPYKGASQALNDLMGGQVQIFFVTSASFVPQSKNPKLRAVAVTGQTRSPALPEVPTFAEAGLPVFDAKTWFGVLAPAGTPKAIVDKLSIEIARSLDQPDFKEKVGGLGLSPFISTSGQFAKLLEEAYVKNAETIKAANIKFEN